MGNIKGSNICVIGVSEKEEIEMRQKNIFKEIMM